MIGNILIIGDQNKKGQELKEALKKETHFTLRLIAMNGISLAEAVKKEADLIVMNPKTSYLEMMDLYYAFKKDPRLQDTPIVLLMDESEMKKADLPSGIQELLYRPLRLTEAVAR